MLPDVNCLFDSGMDNSPRNAYLKNRGTGIDISSEMVLFARQLSEIALILGKDAEAREYSAEAEQLASAINQAMWDEKRKFYFDLMLDGKRAPVMRPDDESALSVREVPREGRR